MIDIVLLHKYLYCINVNFLFNFFLEKRILLYLLFM